MNTSSALLLFLALASLHTVPVVVRAQEQSDDVDAPADAPMDADAEAPMDASDMMTSVPMTTAPVTASPLSIVPTTGSPSQAPSTSQPSVDADAPMGDEPADCSSTKTYDTCTEQCEQAVFDDCGGQWVVNCTGDSCASASYHFRLGAAAWVNDLAGFDAESFLQLFVDSLAQRVNFRRAVIDYVCHIPNGRADAGITAADKLSAQCRKLGITASPRTAATLAGSCAADGSDCASLLEVSVLGNSNTTAVNDAVNTTVTEDASLGVTSVSSTTGSNSSTPSPATSSSTPSPTKGISTQNAAGGPSASPLLAILAVLATAALL